MYRTARRRSLRLSTLLALVLLALSALLIALRVEQLLLEFAQGRSLRVAQQLSHRMEEGLRAGLSLRDQTTLPALLELQLYKDKALLAVRVDDERGQVVAQTGAESAFEMINPVWARQLLAQGGALSRNLSHYAVVARVVQDSTDRPAALVWLVYERAALRELGAEIGSALWPWAAGAGMLLALALAALAWRWMQRTQRLLGALKALDKQPDPALGQSAAYAQVDAQLRRHADQRYGPWLVFSVGTLLVLSALGLLSWKASELVRPVLVEQIELNARTVLNTAQAQIERALVLGVPMERLRGVEAMFEQELRFAPELSFMALTRESGEVTTLQLHARVQPERHGEIEQLISKNLPTPDFAWIDAALSESDGPILGRLVVGMSTPYVDNSLRAMLLDLLLAVLVSLVLVRETLGGLWERALFKPYLALESAWARWRQRSAAFLTSSAAQAHASYEVMMASVRQVAAQLQDLGQAQTPSNVDTQLVSLRLIVFLTALSEELLRPFFAVFASELVPLSPAWSPTMQAGIPVTAFMLTLALAQPLGPWLTQHFEVRRALSVVAVLGALCLGLTAATHSGALVLALRAGSGVCYGLLLILVQTTIVRITGGEQRARGLVTVASAIVAAGVCGPALGGIVADRLGTTAAFAACAACLLLAALTSLRITAVAERNHAHLAGLGGWRGMLAVLRQPRVMAVTWWAAVPARLVAAALLVVVTPLYLLEQGASASVAGRVLLLYFLVFMVSAPWVSRWSDLRQRRKPWVLTGSALSALACAAMPVVGGVAGAALCCALLGLAQALMSAPQLALVTEAFAPDPHNKQALQATPEQALAAFRFIERFGSVLAPLVVALAVAQFGLVGAVSVLGVMLLVCTMLLWASLRHYHEHRPTLHPALNPK